MTFIDNETVAIRQYSILIKKRKRKKYKAKKIYPKCFTKSDSNLGYRGYSTTIFATGTAGWFSSLQYPS